MGYAEGEGERPCLLVKAGEDGLLGAYTIAFCAQVQWVLGHCFISVSEITSASLTFNLISSRRPLREVCLDINRSFLLVSDNVMLSSVVTIYQYD